MDINIHLNSWAVVAALVVVGIFFLKILRLFWVHTKSLARDTIICLENEREQENELSSRKFPGFLLGFLFKWINLR